MVENQTIREFESERLVKNKTYAKNKLERVCSKQNLHPDKNSSPFTIIIRCDVIGDCHACFYGFLWAVSAPEDIAVDGCPYCLSLPRTGLGRTPSLLLVVTQMNSHILRINITFLCFSDNE